jgi:hypothetical protein
MARGGRAGKKRTQYVRDASGRFASAPGGGKKATPSAVRKAARAAALKGGTLAARTSLKKSKAKLAAIDKADETLKTTLSRRAQKGAITRGNKNVRKAISSSRKTLPKMSSNTGKIKNTSSRAFVKSTTRLSQEKNKPRNKTKRKVDIQIRRAKAGGEYGPDGHFYPAGSWMPLGNFRGESKIGKNQGEYKAVKSNEKGASKQVTTIRNKKPAPPIVRPTGDAIKPPGNMSKRGEQNRFNMFGSSGYLSVIADKQRGGVKISGSGPGGAFGTTHLAAIASRVNMKQMGQAISKLRNMAKDKKRFDDNMNYNFNMFDNKKRSQEWRKNEETASYSYAGLRRQGLLPRDAKVQQWRRAQQLDNAVAEIAAQRSKRLNNRRSYQEEYAWVFNNMIGGRAQRKPKVAKRTSSEFVPKRIQLSKIGSTTRPVTTKNLIKAGGNRWQKGPHDRIYFNNKTGAKIFYDRNTRKINVQSSTPNAVAQRMARKVVKMGQVKPLRWSKGRRLKTKS